MHNASLSLVFTCTFHLNQAYGTNIDAGLGLILLGLLLQLATMLNGSQQGVLPTYAGPIQNMQIQLYHFFCIQIPAENFEQNIGTFRRGSRQFDNHARVKALNGGLCIHAIRFMSFIQNNYRLQKSQRVAQRSFYLSAPKPLFALERVEIWYTRQERSLCCNVIVGWKETIKAAAVPKHSKLLFSRPVRRRKHQQKHTKIFRNIQGRKAVCLFKNQRSACRGDIQELTVGMIAILQCAERLAVYLRRGNDPEHQTILRLAIVGVDEIDHLGREQRFTATSGNL